MRDMKTIDDFKVGQIVKLVPKSNHGRNRITQHGELWEVKMVAKTGRFISLNSMGNTWRTITGDMVRDWRRVDINGDSNFEILTKL
jgi:hypothetical protein